MINSHHSSHDTRHHFGLILALVGLTCGVALMSVPARRASAQLIAPSWSDTGNLNAARDSHTATLLPDGKVLVAGGAGNSAELYDPATRTWSSTGILNAPRFFHTATLLQNGKVLVAGGCFSSSAELYDPATGTWSITGSLQIARCDHTATLLPNGKVLVAGGSPSLFNATSSAELYDPATGTWSLTGSLRSLDLDQGGERFFHTATLLANGQVLVAGGETDDGISDVAELYDPSTGVWNITGRLHARRGEHTATLLPSGKVLVAGGQTCCFAPTDTAELYDPATGNWSTTGSLNTARHFQSATLLPNGKLLVTGGSGASNASNTSLNTAELYDPTTATWSLTSSLNTGRYWHTATLLPNSKVLVAGGSNRSGNVFTTLNSAELYDPGGNSTTNPINDVQFFIRQQYLDFLNREPDPSGLKFWQDDINTCTTEQCREVHRINVSAAFFLSIEFQNTGFLVYRLYKASYGDAPGTPVRLGEFLPDTRQIGQGVVVGQNGWELALENNKQTFTAEFVARPRFTSAYATTMTPPQFVDALFVNAGVTPLASERAAAVNEFGSATTTDAAAARARALLRVAENSTLTRQEFNRAFVLMQYFGYLRRNPNDPPEPGLNLNGYNFWLEKLNQFNGNFAQAEMVKAFISSSEYRQRFGQP
jgi:hypothetical protein